MNKNTSKSRSTPKAPKKNSSTKASLPVRRIRPRLFQLLYHLTTLHLLVVFVKTTQNMDRWSNARFANTGSIWPAHLFCHCLLLHSPIYAHFVLEIALSTRSHLFARIKQMLQTNSGL